MRKVMVSEYISLDGVIEEPRWTAPYWNDEVAKFKYDELFSSDALLLGRVTYEGFAEAWPNMKDAQGFGDRMNSLPKFVATNTLKEMKWNASRIEGDVIEEIKKLKEQPGENILIYGSGEFVTTLMQADLIDEYRLLFYPLVLGTGKRLFADGISKNLKVVDTQVFSSGVIALIYKPESKAEQA